MPPTILIVDDVPANVGVLLDVLQDAAFETAVAESGESALEQVAWLAPDLILLDVQMPGLDGFETCRRLKTREATADIPVLFMTALADASDKLRGFQAGAVDYVTKPFHAEEVLARVRAHLELRAQRRLLEERADELDREVQRRVLAERAVQRALDRALVVAGADGAVLFASDRARVLLAKHFPGASGDRVPAALGEGRAPAGLRVTATRGEGKVAADAGGGAANPAAARVYWLEETAAPPTPALLTSLGLTPRETEILFWIAQGKTNAEIGTILGAATATVKKHVENLLPKLGVETRLAAALLANEKLGHG